MHNRVGPLLRVDPGVQARRVRVEIDVNGLTVEDRVYQA